MKNIRVKVIVKGTPEDKIREIVKRAEEVCPVCRTICEEGEVKLEFL